jgi:hypothetical protein
MGKRPGHAQLRREHHFGRVGIADPGAATIGVQDGVRLALGTGRGPAISRRARGICWKGVSGRIVPGELQRNGFIAVERADREVGY